jgi:hypothetical protein
MTVIANSLLVVSAVLLVTLAASLIMAGWLR